jgi:hypothetical protein
MTMPPKDIQTDDDNDSSRASEDNPEPTQEEQLVLAKKENRAVWYLRFTVFLLMGAVALAVCLTVFFGAKNSEQSDFEEDFADMSQKLVESFQVSFSQRLGIYEDFSYEITSYTLDTNTSWPLVALPDFERRAGRTARLANMLSIIILPLVEAQVREEWENFANASFGWKAEGIALQQGVPVEDVEVPPLTPFIYQNGPDGREPAGGPGPYFPGTSPSLILPVFSAAAACTHILSFTLF